MGSYTDKLSQQIDRDITIQSHNQEIIPIHPPQIHKDSLGKSSIDTLV